MTATLLGMALVAVCGIPGAGKSTVAERLKALGHDAWDTDVDGLAGWRDCATKLPVPNPVDWHDPVANAGIEYAPRRDKIEPLRARADETDHPVYLCGMAGDEFAFRDLLDRVILLAVDDETLLHRLATRTNNSYGKAAHERDALLAAHQGWTESYRQRGDIIIDSTQPLDEVVAAVIAAAEACE